MMATEGQQESSGAAEEEFFFGSTGAKGAADDAARNGASDAPAVPAPPRKRGSSRLLILLLLLVAAAAGFYFFGLDLMGTEGAPQQVAVSRPVTKMKVPVRPRAAEKQSDVKEEVVPREAVAAVKPAPAAPAAPSVPAAKPTPVAKAASQPKPVAAKPLPAPAPKPAFALSSGSYLYRGALKKARAAIEKLGYRVVARVKPEPHEMTRLLVGQYGKILAEKRLNEVRKLADGAFLVAEDGKLSVYAGSYLSLDKARRAADMLYAKGVRVEERHVKVELPRTTLRFGSFVTRKEAQNVAAKLGPMGVMEPQVVPLD